MDLQALMLTALASLAIGVLLGPICIPILRRLKFGQTIREEGPQHHKVKAGTPTMGGVMIILAVILGTIRFAVSSMEVVILVLATVAFGLIGFADDFIKVVKKRNLGLRPRQKLFLQAVVALGLFGLVSLYWHHTEQGPSVAIPFRKSVV